MPTVNYMFIGTTSTDQGRQDSAMLTSDAGDALLFQRQTGTLGWHCQTGRTRRPATETERAALTAYELTHIGIDDATLVIIATRAAHGDAADLVRFMDICRAAGKDQVYVHRFQDYARQVALDVALRRADLGQVIR